MNAIKMSKFINFAALIVLFSAMFSAAETVSLTAEWDAPVNSVDGYHLWEAHGSGGLYELRTDEITGQLTQYRFLIEIEPGQSRYFVLTAWVDSQESDYSNEVSYSHPFPVGAVRPPQNVRIVKNAL